MILLDTNVLSALMQVNPASHVIAWLDRQPVSSIWTTSITVFEVQAGIRTLAAGRRQRDLTKAFDALLTEDLAGRVASFDREAAHAAADLWARRQRTGKPVDLRDTQIAGIALARHSAIATRNIRHFADLDIPVVDPWAD